MKEARIVLTDKLMVSLQEKFLSDKFLKLVGYCRKDEASFEEVFSYLSETNGRSTVHQ